MNSFKKPKIIIDPLLGLIDITDIVPLIDTVPFQSLGFKYQLGFAYSIFPAATHTRKQHSLGAYERTRRLVKDWFQYGFLNEREAKNLPIYALYHDIGHGPFSHVTESLGSIDHDERGIKVLEGMKGVIQKSGFDYEFIHDLFARKNPLYLAVFDKNLGMEKLDYLDRDAFYTLGERPGVEYLAHHVYFIDGKIVVNELAADQARDIQDFYLKMYKHVYTRKKSAIVQRLISKMAYYLIQNGLSENELFNLTDFGLLGRFEISPDPKINFYFKRLRAGYFPKLTLEFRHENAMALSGNTEIKRIKVIGINANIFKKTVLSPKLKKVEFLESLESSLAKTMGIPEGSLVVIPPDLKRFEPEDINIYTLDGKIKRTSSVYPDHFQAMKEYGRSHISLRIAVFEEHRKEVYEKAEEVKRYLATITND